jgi:hypothetical protein
MKLIARARGEFMAIEIVLMGLLMALSAVFSVGVVSHVRTKELKLVTGVGCVSTDAREVQGDLNA